jgi:uncharacterized protein (TIGR02145 family)
MSTKLKSFDVSYRYNILFLVLITIFLASCKKNKNPSITIKGITKITSQSIDVEAEIYKPDNYNVSGQGFVLSTVPNPTYQSTCCQTLESGASNFLKNTLTNLSPNTVYYLRAYFIEFNTGAIIYSDEISFTTLESELSPFNPDKVYGNLIDVEGTIYKTIQIGDQTWMAENLKVSKFNDASVINEVLLPLSIGNGGNPAWCYFNDSIQYNERLGKLYNVNVITSTKNVCPTGWHIPNSIDYDKLLTNLPSTNNAGVLKSTGYNFWTSPNIGATNETGFSAVGSGVRNSFDFSSNTGGSIYWIKNATSLEWMGISTGVTGSCNCFYDNSDLESFPESSQKGYSIRCIKD